MKNDLNFVAQELINRDELKLARLVLAEKEANKLRYLSKKIGGAITTILESARAMHNRYKKAKAAAKKAEEGTQKSGLIKKAKAIYEQYQKRKAKAKDLATKRKSINDKIKDLLEGAGAKRDYELPAKEWSKYQKLKQELPTKSAQLEVEAVKDAHEKTRQRLKGLKNKVQLELKPGARFISYAFKLQGIEPKIVKKETKQDTSIFLYSTE